MLPLASRQRSWMATKTLLTSPLDDFQGNTEISTEMHTHKHPHTIISLSHVKRQTYARTHAHSRRFACAGVCVGKGAPALIRFLHSRHYTNRTKTTLNKNTSELRVSKIALAILPLFCESHPSQDVPLSKFCRDPPPASPTCLPHQHKLRRTQSPSSPPICDSSFEICVWPTLVWA